MKSQFYRWRSLFGIVTRYCIKLIEFFIILLVICNNAKADDYTKQWTVDTIIGPWPGNEKVKYYIESQLRLIDDPYIFNQAFLLTGLGYQFTPTVTVFMGPGFIATKNTEGYTYYEYRLWEQLNWLAVDNSSVTLNSRTRFEQKVRNDQSQVALQLRQRLWMRIPIPHFKKYYYSTFDEIFFNINNPSWVSPKIFEQNRAFIGIAKQLTKNTIVDFGYLNQLQFGPPRQMSNVILLSFSTNL